MHQHIITLNVKLALFCAICLSHTRAKCTNVWTSCRGGWRAPHNTAYCNYAIASSSPSSLLAQASPPSLRTRPAMVAKAKAGPTKKKPASAPPTVRDRPTTSRQRSASNLAPDSENSESEHSGFSEASPYLVQRFPLINPEYLRRVDMHHLGDPPDWIIDMLQVINRAKTLLPKYRNVSP